MSLNRKYSSTKEIVQAGIDRIDSDDPLILRNSIIVVLVEDMNQQVLDLCDTQEYDRALTRLDHIKQILEIEIDFDPARVSKEDFVSQLMELPK